MQKGLLLIYTYASEEKVKKAHVSGCPVTKMNVRWADYWRGWEKVAFVPWSLKEAKEYPELLEDADILIYARANSLKEIEEKLCS